MEPGLTFAAIPTGPVISGRTGTDGIPGCTEWAWAVVDSSGCQVEERVGDIFFKSHCISTPINLLLFVGECFQTDVQVFLQDEQYHWCLPLRSVLHPRRSLLPAENAARFSCLSHTLSTVTEVVGKIFSKVTHLSNSRPTN